MMNPAMTRTLLFLTSVIFLASGCGWQLQGRARLPEVVQVAYIDSEDAHSDFTRALQDSLRVSGARVVDDSEDARAVIRVHRDDSGQRVLSVSVRNTPEEYEVFYTVEYSITAGKEELLERQTLELTRDYSYDPSAVLAKQREQALLREALARELASQVVRRMAAL